MGPTRRLVAISRRPERLVESGLGSRHTYHHWRKSSSSWARGGQRRRAREELHQEACWLGKRSREEKEQSSSSRHAQEQRREKDQSSSSHHAQERRREKEQSSSSRHAPERMRDGNPRDLASCIYITDPSGPNWQPNYSPGSPVKQAQRRQCPAWSCSPLVGRLIVISRRLVGRPGF